ncbi:MAG: cupin domain-containing protein [Hyphomicrobiaceae bacterium]
MLTAADIIRRLGLQPHLEGGHYRETFRDPRQDANGRALSTAIYFLLQAGEISRWHTVDAVEVWHWHTGAPLEIATAPDAATKPVRRTLGANLVAGEAPQIVVAPYHWQRARSLGPWTLVGCTVAPAFTFDGFVMAAPSFEPGS